jgi:hypothetical protein
MARDLWRAMEEVWPLPPLESIKNSGQEWIIQALVQVPETTRMMMLMTWWRAWHVRNEVVHHKPAPPIEASRRFLRSYVDSLLVIKQNPMADPVKGKTTICYVSKAKQGRQADRVSSSKTTLESWSSPPQGWSKLNTDAAWIGEESNGGAGMILRDAAGDITCSACWSLAPCGSPLEAELKACIHGLNLAMQWTDEPIIVESDCLEAIRLINDPGPNRSDLAALVYEVKALSVSRPCAFRHISRNINNVSHCLARVGRVNSCSRIWPRSGPDEARLACNQDGTPLP